MKPTDPSPLILSPWVIALQKGDIEAFQKIYELTHERAFRFSLHLTANPNEAEDILQEAYLSALKSIGTLREPARFFGWLLVIIHNQFRMNRRGAKDTCELKTEDLEKILLDETPEQTQHEIMQVQLTLSKIDPDDRLLLLMIDLEGLSYTEAGVALGISENLVRSRVHTARKRFIKQFETQ